jgi:hypothetical protein
MRRRILAELAIRFHELSKRLRDLTEIWANFGKVCRYAQ